jgi:hypothetical protein
MPDYIAPHVVADGVCAEARRIFPNRDDVGTRAQADMLAERAIVLAERNAAFAAKLHRNGRDGREGLRWLAAFMRHWLAGALLRDLRLRAPYDFANGQAVHA